MKKKTVLPLTKRFAVHHPNQTFQILLDFVVWFFLPKIILGIWLKRSGRGERNKTIFSTPRGRELLNKRNLCGERRVYATPTTAHIKEWKNIRPVPSLTPNNRMPRLLLLYVLCGADPTRWPNSFSDAYGAATTRGRQNSNYGNSSCPRRNENAMLRIHV